MGLLWVVYGELARLVDKNTHTHTHAQLTIQQVLDLHANPRVLRSLWTQPVDAAAQLNCVEFRV